MLESTVEIRPWASVYDLDEVPDGWDIALLENEIEGFVPYGVPDSARLEKYEQSIIECCGYADRIVGHVLKLGVRSCTVMIDCLNTMKHEILLGLDDESYGLDALRADIYSFSLKESIYLEGRYPILIMSCKDLEREELIIRGFKLEKRL